MEIGNLNQRISILENTVKIDEIGNHKARWEEIFSCWAAVAVKNSAENNDSGVTKEVQTLEFTVRQNPLTGCISTHANRIVVSYSRKVNRHHKYICRCDCGNTTEVFRDNLLSNHKISCSNCWKVLKEGNYYKYICSNGKSFLFSVEDYELVTKHRWHIDSHGYPKTNINHSTVLLSRLIMNCSDNHYIDHINRNPLDNRITNLRLATAQQNCYNENVRRNNHCGYKGVSQHKGGKYRADIFINGKNRYLGLFKSPQDAAKAYDAAARLYYKEYARLNFPINPNERSCI